MQSLEEARFELAEGDACVAADDTRGVPAPVRPSAEDGFDHRRRVAVEDLGLVTGAGEGIEGEIPSMLADSTPTKTRCLISAAVIPACSSSVRVTTPWALGAISGD